MKIKYFILIIVTGFLASCTKDFFDLKNPNAVTPAIAFETEDGFKSATASIYSAATTSTGCLGFFATCDNDWRTENYTEPNGAMDDYYMYANNSNSWVNNYFSQDYWGISCANQLIQYGEVSGVDQALKDKYIPEGYFWRGIFYFYLVNDFGSVPIRTKVVETQAENDVACSLIPEVWKQVESDLSTAAAKLPKTRPATEAGRATQGTALAYLGRAYIYQEKWDDAIQVLQGIVDKAADYGYDLEPDYENLFDGKHKNGPEGVFETQFYSVGGTDPLGRG